MMTNIVSSMMMAMLIIMLLAMMVICSDSHSSELSFLFNIVVQSLVSPNITLIVAPRLKNT